MMDAGRAQAPEVWVVRVFVVRTLAAYICAVPLWLYVDVVPESELPIALPAHTTHTRWFPSTVSHESYSTPQAFRALGSPGHEPHTGIQHDWAITWIHLNGSIYGG